MAGPLRWGVAGTGMMAHDFLTAMGTLAAGLGDDRPGGKSGNRVDGHGGNRTGGHCDNKVVAVAGTDLDQTHRLATLHRVPLAYEGYEALAKDKTVDIVFVATLNKHHFEITKLMLLNNKHVLCEKPLAPTYKQTKDLVDLAREKKLFLLEGMWSRFFPAYDALNDHLSSGGLGEIFHVDLQFGVEINDMERALMKEFGGGVVIDLGIYMLQFAQMVLKDKPTEVACAGHVSPLGVDEAVSCVLTYRGGRMATLAAHTRVQLGNRAEITGSNGKLVLEQFWCPTVLQTSPGSITEWTLPRAHFRFNFHNSAGLCYEIQECWDCIRRGDMESSKMSLEETLTIAKLVDVLRSQLGLTEEQVVL